MDPTPRSVTSRMAIAARRPTGSLRRLLRIPVALNDRGLGRFLGDHILILEHEGRRTGRSYQTAVEVVAHDEHEPSWTVVAAWGGRPQWLMNIQATGAKAITVAGRRYEAPTQHQLGPTAACDVLVAYVCSHPLAARGLFRALAWPDPRMIGSLRLVSETCTIITFTPSP